MTTAAMTGYRAEIEAALASGWRARNLYATGGGRTVRVLLTAPDGRNQLTAVDADRDGAVPSIVDLAPGLAWDEREAHDLHGVAFSGHEPLRPLIDHSAALKAWTVAVHGHDPYQVAVGPIHAGVIESGHFRFHVVGDRILHLDARLFYKHRGLEHAAAGLPLPDALPVVARACAACSAANGIAYATAVEELLGLRTTVELARARTLLLELERTWNHLNDIAAICAGVGMAAGNAHFLGLTERARRINAAVTGHRFLMGSVAVGHSHIACDPATVRSARQNLQEIEAAAEMGWRELSFNASFQDRLGGVGVVDAPTAARLGVVGPAARATGIADDARSISSYPDYQDFEPATVSSPAGDVQARMQQRMLELRQTFLLLGQILDAGPLNPAQAVVDDSTPPIQIGVGLVESSRGATSCIVERNGDTVGRVRLRTSSYANWPAVAQAAVGNLLPDFPLINKSFELCYACCDR
ncbi:MAG TPA: NADH-quinone oxidoreductase subunit C [Acidimicrobiales bacterium]|nr:NADH-quinone oxidoreductase subunit C [Acidimicrobiales bacterium]